MVALAAIALAVPAKLVCSEPLDDPLGIAGSPVELTAFQGGRVSLEGGDGWLNTRGPIHIEELRGKIVLLDFWTYCCINCHHVLPDLAFLEDKYKNELVVIGVHTAKFPAERDTDNIRKKVAEYRIKHPVINDAHQVLWQRFGVSSWPTLVVIDANGNYRGSAPGEGNRAVLDEVIGRLVAEHRARGELNETPLRFFPESEKPQTTGLLFPGKVVADAAGKRLFVSDTGHNRIVITDLTGKVQKLVGNGTEGLKDGSFEKAEFNRPQGMCLVGETLYVADTENHAIRAIDLKLDRVETVAGTGAQSARRRGSGRARSTGLNSPWDLIQIPGTQSLAVAMAGPHQIWRFDLATGTIGVWAGSGTENIQDGTFASADFAQPSGLATDGETLYVADSEVSGVRAITATGRDWDTVHTIVGVNLFGYGDRDGRGPEVRLQHCLGVVFAEGKLYIADTYNNKVKVCEPHIRSVTTFLGSGKAGSTDDPPLFDEPGGLSYAGGTLFVADTNNHLIRTVDLKTRKVSTLAIDVKAPSPEEPRPSFPRPVNVKVAPAKVAPGSKLSVDVSLTLPEGFKLSPDVRMPYLVEEAGTTGLLDLSSPAARGVRLDQPDSRFTIPVMLTKPAEAGQTLDLKVSVGAFFCSNRSSLCTVKSFVWNVPITFVEGAPASVALETPPAVDAAP
jgi:thiol-disulfide isomerase/thioredoxin